MAGRPGEAPRATPPELVIFGPDDAVSRAVAAAWADEGAVRVGDARAAGSHGAGVRDASADAVVDVVDPDAVRELLGAHEPRVVIFQPGWLRPGTFLAGDDGAWRAALRADFEAGVIVLQAAARRLIELGRGGRLLVISHVVGREPLRGAVAAGTALAALEALCGMAAVDLAPHGVTVNTVSLGWVRGSDAWTLVPERERARLLGDVPTGRAGDPEAVARVCRLLASPGMGDVTGAVVPVDGGFTLTRGAGVSPLLPRET